MSNLEFTPYTSLRSPKGLEKQANSPSYNRIQQLNDKLSNLQVDTQQSNFKKEGFEERLKILEDTINKQQSKESEQFNLIKEDLIKLSNISGQQMAIIQDIQQVSIKQIKTFENDYAKQQTQERTLQKENDVKIVKAFEESCFNLKQQWKKDTRKREQAQQYNKNQLESEIASLEDAITLQIKTRQQKNEGLIISLSTALTKISNTINQQKKLREENHLLMLKTLQDLNTTMQSQIKQEQLIRQKADDLLYKLLEQTCNKKKNILILFYEIYYLNYIQFHQEALQKVQAVILLIKMKKKLSQGLIDGFNILQKKYQAEYQPKQIQSARKLIQQQYTDQYGLKNKKIRLKKDKKQRTNDLITQALQSRKQSNTKMKIDLKMPLMLLNDHKIKKDAHKKLKKQESNIINQKNGLQCSRTSRFINSTKSILSRSSKKSQRSQMKSILGRLSNGDDDKQKYLIEVCRQNLNQQFFMDQDIFGLKNTLNVSRSSIDKYCDSDKQSSKKFCSNPQSQKQTALGTQIPNSMESSYVQQQDKKKTKIVINPLLFNYQDDKEDKKMDKPRSIKSRIIKGKNCYSESSGDQ